MIPEAAAHTREVIAVHEGIGEEAICAECYTYWPCKAIREMEGAK